MAEMLVDGAKLDACLDAEADAIRAKTGGLSPIPYDYANNKGFADAIAAIETGGGVTTQPLSVTENGTYTAPSGTAYTPVTVNVPQPSGTKNITIIANGTITEDVKNYVNASITVDVPSENPNSYNVITGTLSNPWALDVSPSVLANLLSQRNATAFLAMTIPNAGSYILPVALDEWENPSVFVVSALMYSPAAGQTTPNGCCILYSVADGSLISAYMYVNGTLTDVSTQMAQLPTELQIITHPLEI